MPKQILAVSLADQSAPSEIFLLKSENFEDSKQLVDANKTKKFDNEIIPVVVPQSMNIGKVLSLLMVSLLLIKVRENNRRCFAGSEKALDSFTLDRMMNVYFKTMRSLIHQR